MDLFCGIKPRWYKCLFLVLHSLATFSGGYKDCSQVTLPCLSLPCSELFLWAPLGCAHVSFSLATHYPYFLMFILTDGKLFFWTMCLGVGCVDVGRLLLPLLVLCQVQCFPAPALLSWLRQGLLHPSLCIPRLCCLWRTCSISIVCLSDAGYADCTFISVMLPWFTLPLTNLWLLFSPFLFFC